MKQKLFLVILFTITSITFSKTFAFNNEPNKNDVVSANKETVHLTSKANRSVTNQTLNERACVELVVNEQALKDKLLQIGVDSNSDGTICESEARNFKGTLDLGNIQFQDPTGIEKFINVEAIYLMGNSLLEKIDLSALTSLKEIHSNTLVNLTSLTIAQSLPSLETLNISNTKISNVNLTAAPNLKYLDLSYNTTISSVNIEGNINLEKFNASGCTKIKKVNFSKNVSIKEILLKEVGLVSVDVSAVKALEVFDCQNNPDLEAVNLANSSNSTMTGSLFAAAVNLKGNPNLTCIQVDAGFTPSSNNWLKDSRPGLDWGTTPCAILSVNDVALSSAIKIFPNPVKDVLKVTVAQGTAIKQITIYNALGAKVVQTTKTEININALSSGVYFIKIEDKLGKIATKKIVKQ